jgi:hypothetical protein
MYIVNATLRDKQDPAYLFVESFHVFALARMNEYLIDVDRKKGGRKTKFGWSR